MALHGTLMESLLTWVNSLKVDEPIERLSQMQDLSLLIKIVSKLNGKVEESSQILRQPLEERLKFLQRHCRCGSKAEDLVQWEKILQGENSELEISKVIVLLFYVSNMKCKNAQEWETFDHKTQTELATILRFVLDNEDDLSLDDKLIRFLQRKARIVSSSDSASSSDETMSPHLSTRQTQVRFLELQRVASSSTMKSLALDSPSSPMSEVLHMPQFQIRRLRKQLTEGRELRDELELELSETKKRLAEKDAQIFLMQQRIERLVVLNEKQADQQEPRELEELREKNESLMIRLRDALKQCQDMKTDRSQLERKNDQLSEENGDLSYKVRDLSSRLAQLQGALNDTTEEHEMSVANWRQQQSRLENELSTVVSEKKCLDERNQILEGKISMLEDQIKMMRESGSPVKGERMGDVLKLEHLQQEIVALNGKSTELQAQVVQLEEDKTAALASFESQKSRFESEKMQLQDIVTNLQTSLSEITFQKERQDQEARLQEEKLTCQITTLKLEISKLKSSLAQKDKEISGLSKEVEEERRQKGELAEVLQRQEESSKKTIGELNSRVDHLGGTLKLSEDKLLELTEKLSAGAQQIVNLQHKYDKLVDERDSTLTMFGDYRKVKEEELSVMDKTLQNLQKDHEVGLAALEELKKEKAELALKVQELDATILDLIAKCQNLDIENDSQSKSHAATLESLRTQLTEQDAQFKIFKQKVSGLEQVSEENGQIKEHLVSLEDTVKNLNELLENEKRHSASLESERERNLVLQGDLKKLNESSEQALAELGKEKAISKKFESQLCRLEEELRARTEDLQQKLSETSTVIRQREDEIEKLAKEMGSWKDRAQSCSRAEENFGKLKKEHDEVCQELEKQRLKVSEIEAQTKAAMSTQLNRVSELESALSAARTQLEEKEAQEEKLLQTLHSTEEKLQLAQQEEAEHISQLETSCSNTVQDLKLLSRELTEEMQKKAELEETLKKLEEEKSKTMLTLKSDIGSMQATIKEREREAEKLSTEVERLRKQLEEANLRHQQELVQKDTEVSRLVEEKERAVSELKTEQTIKMEMKAQLQKSMDSHKNEFSALQNELSRSLDLITIKESEVERLAKELAAREEECRQEKQTVAKLSEQVAPLKALKEQVATQEEEIKRYIQTAKAAESEITVLKATIGEKEKEVERLESDIQCKITANSSIHEQHQATVGDVKVLKSKIAELEKRCREEEDALSSARKEVSDAKTAALEITSESEKQQKRIQALVAEIQQGKQTTSELTRQLEESRSLQSERESSLEALKKELFHKVQELEQSQKSLSESGRELSSVVSDSREQEKSLAEAKEQIAQYQKDIEKTSGQTDSMHEELKNMTAKLATNENSYLEVKKLLEKESSRSSGLENQLKIFQEKLEVSTKELQEKQAAVQSLRTEASSYKEEAEKQRVSVEGLQKKLASQEKSIAKLEQDIIIWQEKCSQKEEQISGVQQQLSDSQGLLKELESIRSSYKELNAEQTRKDNQYKEDHLKNQKTAESLQVELEKTKEEVASLISLKDSLCQKETMLETLQKEKKDYVKQISSLQDDNKKLVVQNKSLSQASNQVTEKMETELSKVSEKHIQELQSVRVQYEKMVSEGKEQIQELSQKLEAVTSKYDHAKTKVLDERQKFQEEKQKLLAQVEQMEGAKKVQSEQVLELNKQLNQQEKTIQGQQEKLKRDGAAQEEVEKKQKRVTELEAKLEQQVQAVEHYKAQMEKAKLHYDAKKQQNQELSNDLQKITQEQEQLRKENAENKMESERLAKELHLSVLQTKESEQSCKTLTNQVRSLEAQMEFADRQLRELGKFQVATDAMKSRETLCPTRVTRSHPNVSIDSLDMSEDDEDPMNSTRKNGRSHQEPSTSAQSTSPEPPASGRLPRKVESLESLYFTPIPNRVQSKLDASLGSIGDLSLDSSKKTRSARRRTTQVINITMTKKTKEEVEPESANTSFYSLRSAPSHQNLHQQNTRRGGRPQPASSAPAITSLPSQESLVKSEHTSSDDSLNNSALMNLPGYRPTTRSSARLSQAGGGRSSFYMSTCQDEPDPLEDWTRIAELQLRNRSCLPHLKTSYPLESRPNLITSTITDEEVKTGDPKETLRRATLLPNQIRESVAGARRKTLAPTGIEWGEGGVTTRQQVKRVTEESHYGPDTPESKKSASCFPRPMTPKDRAETRRMSTVESKPSASQQSNTSRRQSMAFTILTTPKKLGSNLLKRGLNKKTTPKNAPQGRRPGGSSNSSPHRSISKSPSRRSPRGSTAKSPRLSKFFERNKSRNK
ncbi:nuclear mitotic apparatus protein 1 isoform X2 [Mixophyes fleayi]|uniref:nuclear mitotic apparatus protein 1 isoform X2 n=1 Tax=Mixophyes fleayi TaxID=3061075 RepID=UPI003F4E3332